MLRERDGGAAVAHPPKFWWEQSFRRAQCHGRHQAHVSPPPANPPRSGLAVLFGARSGRAGGGREIDAVRVAGLGRSTQEIGARLAEMSMEMNSGHGRGTQPLPSEHGRGEDPYDELDRGRDSLNHYEGLDGFMGEVCPACFPLASLFLEESERVHADCCCQRPDVALFQIHAQPRQQGI